MTDSFAAFVTNLTAGDADLIAMRANTRPGKSANKALQVKRNAKVGTARAPKTIMTHKEKSAMKTDLFNEQNPGLYDFLRAATWSEFAQSLADQIASRGSLSDKQIAAATNMRLKVEARDAAPAAPAAVNPALQGFDELEAILGRIADSGNKWPTVRCQTNAGVDGDDVLRLDVAFALMTAGKNTGKTKVTIDEVWAGFISGGTWNPSAAARNLTRPQKVAVWDLMKELKADAESTFAAFGKRTCKCSMCGRPLSNDESVALGIGPICRGKMFG